VAPPQTPLGELTALPKPPCWIWTPLRGSGGGLGWGRGGKEGGKWREGEVDGREREGPQVTVEPKPLRDLLRCVTSSQILMLPLPVDIVFSK